MAGIVQYNDWLEEEVSETPEQVRPGGMACRGHPGPGGRHGAGSMWFMFSDPGVPIGGSQTHTPPRGWAGGTKKGSRLGLSLARHPVHATHPDRCLPRAWGKQPLLNDC